LSYSNFSDVFNEDHFINALANDVKVIKKLPMEMGGATRADKYFKSWSGMDYYQGEIASMWADYKVYQLECSVSLGYEIFMIAICWFYSHLLLKF
jgi:hypothetical protein